MSDGSFGVTRVGVDGAAPENPWGATKRTSAAEAALRAMEVAAGLKSRPFKATTF
jgi:hypothetical protein